jgi:hypothetical protein
MPLPRLVRACVLVRVRVRVRACVRRRSLGYSLHAIHLLHSILGSSKTAPFQLPSPLPATRGHTKALLQSVLADTRSQRLRLVTLMPPATEQQRKRKREATDLAKNSSADVSCQLSKLKQRRQLISLLPKQ